MKLIARAQWDARPPKSRIATVWSRRTEFVVHHSEGPTTQTVRSIQDFHMDVRKWSDIAYNFLVNDSGTIYEGRGWLTVGAHAKGHNTAGIGVCYIGQNAPTDAAKRAIRVLYDYACDQAGYVLLKRGHGQLSGNSTDCPGSNLLAWVKAGMLIDAEDEPIAPPFAGRLLKVTNPLIHGSDVLAWQKQMRLRGWTIVTDGYYGADSAAVCRKFQDEKHLGVDGIVGMRTWSAAWEASVT